MERVETEWCPNCEEEVYLLWDVEKDGFVTKCPGCGEELALCDACSHAKDNPGGICDWTKSDSCWRLRANAKSKNYELAKRIVECLDYGKNIERANELSAALCAELSNLPDSSVIKKSFDELCDWMENYITT